VINAADGSVAGTIDLGGQPEEAASDGNGHIYIDLEDKDAVAAVDAKTMKLTATYDLGGKGGGPGGLAMDAKNHILFSFCHDPQTVVILNADDGKIITSLPIGNGVDAAEFNPDTMEAFSSQGDGTLTVIKENSPTDFVVEQSVTTLDSKTGQIYLITADMAAPATRPAADAPAGGQAAPGGGRRRGGRGQMVPDSFTILVVGK
jgi:DNA-binding beta-propeller fold protein YncE